MRSTGRIIYRRSEKRKNWVRVFKFLCFLEDLINVLISDVEGLAEDVLEDPVEGIVDKRSNILRKDKNQLLMYT